MVLRKMELLHTKKQEREKIKDQYENKIYEINLGTCKKKWGPRKIHLKVTNGMTYKHVSN